MTSLSERVQKAKMLYESQKADYDSACLARSLAEERLKLIEEEIRQQGWDPQNLEELLKAKERELEDRLSELERQLNVSG